MKKRKGKSRERKHRHPSSATKVHFVAFRHSSNQYIYLKRKEKRPAQFITNQVKSSPGHDGNVGVGGVVASASSEGGKASGTAMPATARDSRTQAGTGLLGPGNCWARKRRTKRGKLPSMMDCRGGVGGGGLRVRPSLRRVCVRSTGARTWRMARIRWSM